MTTAAAAVPWRERRTVVVVLRLVGQALEFLAWVLLARRLPGQTLGDLTVVFLACRYGGLIADWGARYSGMRDIAAGLPLAGILPLLRRRERLTAGLAVLFVGWATTTGNAAMLPLLAVLLQQGLNRDWMSLGQRRMFRSGLPVLLQGAVLLPLVYLVPEQRWTVALVLGGSYALGLLVSCLVNRRPQADPAQPQARGVAGWMVVAALADQAVATMDVFLLAYLVSSTDAGMYAAIYRLPNAWLAVVGLVSVSSVPAVAAGLAASPSAARELRSAMLRRGLAAGALTLAGAPIVLLATPLVFGDEYSRAATAAAVLVCASAVITVTAALLPIYFSVVSDARYAQAQVSAAAVNLAMNLALIPALGMVGAAISTFAAQVLLSLLIWRGLRATVVLATEPVGRPAVLSGSYRREQRA